MSHIRLAVVSLIVCALSVSFAPLLAASAAALLPASAPHGARAIIVGSGLDAGSTVVSFAAAGGGTAPAAIISQSADVLEIVVPSAAASGPVTVTSGGATLAILGFTLLPDPALVTVTTLGESVQAHDLFKDASGVAVASSGKIYVTDTLHHQVKILAPDGQLLSTIGTGDPGFVNGPAGAAKFKQPAEVVVDVTGSNIYVADTGNNVIREIAPDGTVTTFAGSGAAGDADGPASLAAFKQPIGLAFDLAGNLLVADSGNHRIRLITPAGTVTTLAGGVHDGFADGAAAQALFKQPSGIIVSPSGVVFVADTGNNRIRKIEAGQVSTVAGTGQPGLNDGSPLTAQFNQPSAIASDDAGNLFIADTLNHAIRKVAFTPSGTTVSTVSGNGSPGYVDGATSVARFKQPAGIDFKGALFIGDAGNDALRVIYSSVTLSAVYPRSGSPSGGTVVRLFGTGFVPGATSVLFGGVAPSSVSYISSTEIIVSAPAGVPGTVDVAITTPGGTALLTGAFSYLPPPTISSVAPVKGTTAGGNTLTITGTNFVSDDTTVTIGGVQATSVAVTSSSSLSVVTPPGADGAADITVTTSGGSATKTAVFTYFAPPVITGVVPAQGGSGATVTITGQNFDPDPSGDQVLFGTLSATVTSASATQLVASVPNGATTGKITVVTAGGTAVSASDFVVSSFTKLQITSPATTLDAGQSLQFNAIGVLITGVGVDVTSKTFWTSSSASVSVTSTGIVTAMTAGGADITAILGGLTATVHVSVNPLALPPDPATVAPKVDSTIVGVFADTITFLVSGPNAIQTGVASNTINDDRATVIRGTVRTLSGAGLAGVHVSVLNHHEYGETLSRADGVFDFVVNGGGALTLKFDKPGYVPAQRAVATKWNQQRTIDDVALVAYDAQTTLVTFGGSSTQVARGSIITDQDGARQGTLLIPAGAGASLVLPDGTAQTAASLHLRATEFSVGPLGPNAIPAALPATSGYTYCVELSADEAVSAGATTIRFSAPVAYYIDNFLSLPAGTIVPVGYYDRQRATWVASANGVILTIVSITNGLADVDTNGDGVADGVATLALLGIDNAERQTLATLYTTGKSLWRVPLTHLTPIDGNFGQRPAPQVPPAGAASPLQPQPSTTAAPSPNDGCSFGAATGNSVVNCYARTLTEALPIAGTPFALEYDSARHSPTQYTTTIRLSGATVPSSLKRIELSAGIAGRQTKLSFLAQPNLSYDFTWDGRDVYGRPVPGARELVGEIDYIYDAVYALPPNDGSVTWAIVTAAAISRSPARQEYRYAQSFSIRLGSFPSDNSGFGDWTLSAQKSYDGGGRTLYDGAGEQRSGDPNQTKQLAVTTVGGTTGCCFSGDGGPATAAKLDFPTALGVAPDSSVYIVDQNRIRKIDPSGIITTVAGNGIRGFTADGAPALGSPIAPSWVAVAPNGDVYFAEFNERVRRIVDGSLATVAGNGTSSSSFSPLVSGVPATSVAITPNAIAFGSDGSLYIGDPFRLLRVSGDGIVTTLDHGFYVNGVAAADDGTVYASDNGGLVYRITRDGSESVYAGNTTSRSEAQDGQKATNGFLSGRPRALAVAPDGTLLIACTGTSSSAGMIAAVTTDGAFHRLLGTFNYPPFTLPPNGTLGRATDLSPFGVGISPDGSVYFTDFSINLVRRADNVFPRLSRGDTIIPSADAREVYVFGGGRHVRTLDPLTGLALLTFTYDTNGFVTRVTDIDGKETVIEREATGKPLAIVARGGQRTTLTIGTGGKLASISNPANESYAFTYGTAGLLESLTDPRSGQHTYHYDVKGGVIDDQGPDGTSISLHRTDTGQSYSVTRTSAEGRTHTYNVVTSPDTSESREIVAPDGTTSKFTFADVITTATAPDGSKTASVTGADPRFGMQSPFTVSSTTTAGGQTMKVFATRTATLSNNADPFSVTRLTSTLTINGASWSSTYDKPTLTETTRSPLGRTTTLVTDAKGRPSSIATPLVTPFSFGYTNGLLTTLQQGSREVAFTYDGKQRLATVTDPLNRVNSFSYDDADRVISQLLPDGRVVMFSYDPAGNLTSVTPPSRPPHAFAFTSGNQLAGYMPPAVGGTGATTYRYNHDRQLTAIIRPDGTTVPFSYDAARGTLMSVGLLRGTYQYSYDQQTGAISSITAPDSGQLSFGYTSGLLTSTTWAGAVSGSIRWSRDNFFAVAGETIGTDTISFGYDSDRLLTRAGALTLTYDAQNGLLANSSIGTVADAYTYNEFAELAQYTASASSGSFFTQQFTRDPAGRIQRKIETIAGDAHAFDYIYDDAGRLTGVVRDGNTGTTYRYDENSNRVARINGSATDVATYDLQDRLLTYGTSTYQYSANGELTSKTTDAGTSRYTYDEIGNLLSVNLPDGTRVEYVIDGANRRIGKKLNGVLVQSFLYSGSLRIAAELDGSGALVSRFVYSTRVNVPDYMVRGGVTYRIISDQVGSPRLVVDVATGLVMQRLDYDEFGNVLYDSLPGFQPFGFAGGLYDLHTSLVRFGARDYDPRTGRWTAKDPIGFAAGDSALYEYSFGDPVNYIDPSGLDSFTNDPHVMAALASLMRRAMSDATKSEYSAVMYTDNGGQKYHCLGLGSSKAGNENSRTVPTGMKNEVYVHTHPDGRTEMADDAGDVLAANKMAMTDYVLSRSGIHKFVPNNRGGGRETTEVTDVEFYRQNNIHWYDYKDNDSCLCSQ